VLEVGNGPPHNVDVVVELAQPSITPHAKHPSHLTGPMIVINISLSARELLPTNPTPEPLLLEQLLQELRFNAVMPSPVVDESTNPTRSLPAVTVGIGRLRSQRMTTNTLFMRRWIAARSSLLLRRDLQSTGIG
jgi:hypothetical protein